MAVWRPAQGMPDIEAARDAALDDAAEYILETANRTIPIEETTLQRSGDTDVADGQAAVSYETVYAVIQHEATDFQHDPGRRAKWLEMTVKEEAAAVREILADSIRRRLR